MRPGSPYEHLPQVYGTRGIGNHPSPGVLTSCGDIQLATTAPPSADASRLTLSILDQGALGSCTAQAIAQAVRASHVRQLLAAGWTMAQVIATPPPLLARLALYWLERARWGQSAFDSGSYLATGLEELNALGFSPERFWPYIIERFADRPSTMALVASAPQRAPNKYVPITGSDDERIEMMKRALASDYHVVAALEVTVGYVRGDYDFTQPIPPPKHGETIAGGHAMDFEKYDQDGAVTPGTWGRDAGINGRMKLTWDYIATSTDAWIVEAAPLYAADLLQEAA